MSHKGVFRAEGQKPEVDTIDAVPETGATDDSGEMFDYADILDSGGDSGEVHVPPRHWDFANSSLSSSASLLAILQRNLTTYMLPQGTEFTVRLNVSMVNLVGLQVRCLSFDLICPIYHQFVFVSG